MIPLLCSPPLDKDLVVDDTKFLYLYIKWPRGLKIVAWLKIAVKELNVNLVCDQYITYFAVVSPNRDKVL